MTILALDIAKKTGWASSTGKSGVLDLSDYMGDHGAMGCVFQNWLGSRFSEFNVTRLVIERTFSKGRGVDNHIQGLAFVAHMTAFYRNVSRAEHTSNAYRDGLGIPRLKMSRTERKRAGVEWARGQGFDVQSSDEADALALLTYELQSGQSIHAVTG